MIVIVGIQSSCGVTCFIQEGKIINHLYPDVDRSIGQPIPLQRVVKERKRVLCLKYKPYVAYIPEIDIIVTQAQNRQKIEEHFFLCLISYSVDTRKISKKIE